MQESSKLEFYRNLKQEYKFDNYIQMKRQKTQSCTKLRINAHKLHIETGRYNKYDRDLKKYTNIPKDERRCQTCPNEVTDEYHFLFKCQRNLALRRESLNQMELIEAGLKIKKANNRSWLYLLQKTQKQLTFLQNMFFNHSL